MGLGEVSGGLPEGRARGLTAPQAGRDWARAPTWLRGHHTNAPCDPASPVFFMACRPGWFERGGVRWRTGWGNLHETHVRPLRVAFVVFGANGGIVRGERGLWHDAAPFSARRNSAGLHAVHGVVGAVEGVIE